jgi:hypothetical protein
VKQLTAKQESFIRMMKSNDELAWKGFQLLLQREDFPHFFEPLQEAGFFDPKNNPAPEPGERENTIRIPYWRPLGYLGAVAKHSGTQNDLQLAGNIMKIVRDVTNWRDENGQPRLNYHTNSTFAEVFGAVPTQAVTLSDIDLLGQWLKDPYERMLIAHALDKVTISRFLDSKKAEDWDKATRLLFHVTAIVWRGAADDREPTPVTVVDDYWLASLIKNHAKQIGRRSRIKAAQIMLARVKEVFNTPMRKTQSSVFRPAVEDDTQNYESRGAENRVVEGLRDVMLGWAEDDPTGTRKTVKRMLTDEFEIVRRVGIYVVAQHWNTMRNLYTSAVAKRFFVEGHNHELYHLLQDRFAEMSAKQQTTTLAAVEGLPRPKNRENPDRVRRFRQYRWLSAVRGKGNETADKRFAELDSDQAVGRLSEHPDYDSYISSSWVGAGPTPYSPEELIAFAQSKVLAEKINMFVPVADWRRPTLDGLTSAIDAAVRTAPDVFFESLSEFIDVKPIYQQALIKGAKQAWESKTDANWDHGWERLVTFFEGVVAREQFWQQSQDIYQHWVVSIIADCLQAGTKNDERAFNPDLLTRTQGIIKELLLREPGVASPADDAMFQAMNTSKGRIIEALYSQALRSARVSDQRNGSHQEAWNTISPLFKSELDKCQNSNFEFSTLTGNYLPQLQYLDSVWTNEHVDQIFPPAYEANVMCALDGLAYAAFTRPVYELLSSCGVIDRALDLQLKGRSARDKLLERIGAAYLWGIENLDGKLFTRLFDIAKASELNVLVQLFWMVRNDKLRPEQRERILLFWERCLQWAHAQDQKPVLLLSRLSLLASHIMTLEAREQNLLRSVVPYTNEGHEAYEFIAELLRLAPQAPKAISEILQSMVEVHAPDYDYQDRLLALLELLAEQGQREKVIIISDRLRHLSGVESLFKKLTQR